MKTCNQISRLAVESQTPPGEAAITVNYYAKFSLGETFLEGVSSPNNESHTGRGLNVVKYNPVTLEPVDGIKTFDTWGNPQDEGIKFAQYIDSIENDFIIAVAVCDSAAVYGQKVPMSVIETCKRLGSTEIQDVGYRTPWAMITRKGFGKVAENLGVHSENNPETVNIEDYCFPESSEMIVRLLANKAPVTQVQFEGKQVSLKEAITESIVRAKNKGKELLDPDLYNGLKLINNIPVGWPETFNEYLVYLNEFAKYIPKQSDQKAWQKPGTEEYQEVYDHLCHFYYLIDQTETPIQSTEWFSKWLVKYANAWGSFLNTTESFSAEVLQSFIELSPEYCVQDSLMNGKPNNPSGWLTFNQFFARELNPGLRPITSPEQNTVITSPADCTYRNHFNIDSDSKVEIKGTHKYSVEQLLEGSKYKDAFANGVFMHCFLGPYSYHRFHTPVSGKIEECYAIHEKVYLDVEIKDGQFDAPDSSADGYEFSQARGVITIDTKGSPFGDIGVVAIIPVGMAQVSSVNMTATVGANTLKGDEFGYFLFGGSDIILLFQEQAQAQIEKRIMEKQGTDNELPYIHYGNKVATLKIQ